MKLGGKILGSATALAIAACAGNQGKLEIRATTTGIAPEAKPVPLRIAEARGQLRLGNVALALESFRKAVREDPTSTDALTGIAACYDRMGRFDLARRNYEAALAISPGDVQILEGFAASLALQGRTSEAAAVRSEIAARLTVPVVAMPATEPDPLQSSVQIAASDPLSSHHASEAEEGMPSAEPREQASADIGGGKALPEAPAIGRSVTMALPSAREQHALAAPAPTVAPAAARPSASVTMKLPPPRPFSNTALQARSAASATEPRIERLSMGEVALITAAGPLWRSQTAASGTGGARFVPLRREVQSADVRLLNAARVNRLAARTRAYLAGRGWRSISIGDADAVRGRSIILYPTGKRETARRLSAQFGFSIAPAKDVRQVTVLLGRDSVRITGPRAGG